MCILHQNKTSGPKLKTLTLACCSEPPKRWKPIFILILDQRRFLPFIALLSVSVTKSLTDLLFQWISLVILTISTCETGITFISYKLKLCITLCCA